jgi:hypothetical protein
VCSNQSESQKPSHTDRVLVPETVSRPSVYPTHARSPVASTHGRSHNLSRSLVASPLFSLDKSLGVLVQRGSESSPAQGVTSPTQLRELVDFT